MGGSEARKLCSFPVLSPPGPLPPGSSTHTHMHIHKHTHTHVLTSRYYDAWVDEGDGHLYLQLEWCPGGSLEDLAFPQAQEQQQPTLMQGVNLFLSVKETEGGQWRATEAELLMVLRDAALALHHMHRREMAHMDVKVR